MTAARGPQFLRFNTLKASNKRNSSLPQQWASGSSKALGWPLAGFFKSWMNHRHRVVHRECCMQAWSVVYNMRKCRLADVDVRGTLLGGPRTRQHIGVHHRRRKTSPMHMQLHS